MSATVSAEADAARPGVGLRREVAVLCGTEITSWGALFYALPVAAGTISADRGWPLTHVLGAFTLAQVVAGICGPWIGSRIDAVGPRLVMTVGSLAGAGALAGVGSARSLAEFYLAWVVAGAAISATLYAPAFTAITGWTRGDERRRLRALTAVTLVAGLASTVFAPLTAWLLGPLGWRGTYFVLAALVAVTAIAHWWGLRTPWPGAPSHPDPGGARAAQPAGNEAPFRRADFWVLVAGMTLAGFSVAAVVINLVPLLVEHGLSVRAAAVVLGLGGVGQVAGRLFYVRLASATSPAVRTWAVLAVVTLSTLGLAEIQRPLAVIAVLSFVGGMARGLFTLIQATAVADRWGPYGYGRRNGILSGAMMAAAAFAPWVGALIASALDGYGPAFWCLAGATAVAAVLIRPVPRGSLGSVRR